MMHGILPNRRWEPLYKILLVLWVLLTIGSAAQAQITLAQPPKLQFFNSSGQPLAGGLVYTYAAGTNTQQATYTDYTGNTMNSDPVILDAGGFPTGGTGIWLGGLCYKFVVQNSLGVQQYSVDHVCSIGALIDIAVNVPAGDVAIGGTTPNTVTGYPNLTFVPASGSLSVPEVDQIFMVDGVTYTTVQEAIAAACAAGGGTVDARGLARTTSIISGLTQLGCASGEPLVIVFDETNIYTPSSASVNMFQQLPGAQVYNLSVDYHSVTGYSGIVYQLSGNIYNNQPGYANSSFTDVHNLSINGAGNTTATNILFQSINGVNDFIQFLHWGDIKINGGLYGILINLNNSGWFNGNIIDGFQDILSVYPLKFITANLATCNMNTFNDPKIEAIGSATMLKAIWITGTYECNYNQFNHVQSWDYNVSSVSEEVDSPALGNNFTGGLLLGQAVDDGLNGYYDSLNGFGWGGLAYATGLLQAPFFNATNMSAYRINGNGVMGTDLTSTYVTGYNTSTGSVIMSIGPSGGPGQYLFSLTPGGASGGFVTLPNVSGDPMPSTGAGRPSDGSCWFNDSLVAMRCELGGLPTTLSSVMLFPASLVTTDATSDNVTVTGMTSSGHCTFSATNTSAASNIATTFISAKTTNQITVTHTTTAMMDYDFLCTPN